MRWRKLGLLWAPDGRLPWAHSHAMLPTPMRLADGRLRILLGVCDANIVSRVGWIEIHEKDPRRVINVAQEPVLDIGAPGHFDDNGVNPCCAVTLPDGSVRLYYVGYQLQRNIPYTLFTGSAPSTPGCCKHRISSCGSVSACCSKFRWSMRRSWPIGSARDRRTWTRTRPTSCRASSRSSCPGRTGTCSLGSSRRRRCTLTAGSACEALSP